MACSGTKNLTRNAPLASPPSGAFDFTEVSTDKSYGYSSKNPIMVGGSAENEGPRNERRFLDVLAGPNGEPISYRRSGNCCAFKTENGFMGSGLLDMYEIRWEGSDEVVVLYINMYDYTPLKVPVGFTRK